jgi:two-component system CheB/CheR fusion protein
MNPTTGMAQSRPRPAMPLGGRTRSTRSDLFAQQEKRQRIFVRRPVPSPRGDMSTVRGPRHGGTSQTGQRPSPGNHFGPAEKLLLEVYSPAAMVVNEQLRIVHTRGRTGCYRELAAGNPDLHVLRMARPGLLQGLRAALLDARRKDDLVLREGQRIDLDGREHRVDPAVWPLAINDMPHYLVVFEKARSDDTARSEASAMDTRPAGDDGGARPRRGQSAALSTTWATASGIFRSCAGCWRRSCRSAGNSTTTASPTTSRRSAGAR